jgi:hypothetical protein
MSTPFTQFPIEDISQLNALIASCSCCELPVCPAPTIQYESIEYEAGGEEPVFTSSEVGSSSFSYKDGDSLVKARFRFKVPFIYTGLRYEVSWSFLFYPKDWDLPLEGVGEREVVGTGSWVWELGSTRNSSWFDLDPPTEDGSVGIVNLSITCY